MKRLIGVLLLLACPSIGWTDDGRVSPKVARSIRRAIVQGGIGPIGNLRGRVDSNNALVVTAVAAGTIGAATAPIANLPGKVDASNNLLVTFGDGSQVPMPIGATCVTPGIAFTGDTDTGIGWLGANNAAGCAAGATSFDWNTTRVLSAVDVQLGATNLVKWGTTASFPALKRSSTSLGVRLADDSADAPFSASRVVLGAAVAGTVALQVGTLAGTGIYSTDGQNNITFASAGVFAFKYDNTPDITMSSAASLGWGSATAANAGLDTIFQRVSANRVKLFAGGAGALGQFDAGTLTADTLITSPVLQGTGTGTSVANVGANSCGTSAASIAGNQVSGVITVGATAGTQCRVTFTTAAPTARDCTVTDSTTTIATRATVVDTTHTDFLGAFVAGDKVTYQCTVR